AARVALLGGIGRTAFGAAGRVVHHAAFARGRRTFSHFRGLRAFVGHVRPILLDPLGAPLRLRLTLHALRCCRRFTSFWSRLLRLRRHRRVHPHRSAILGAGFGLAHRPRVLGPGAGVLGPVLALAFRIAVAGLLLGIAIVLDAAG